MLVAKGEGEGGEGGGWAGYISPPHPPLMAGSGTVLIVTLLEWHLGWSYNMDIVTSVQYNEWSFGNGKI